jgi:hypothetical protein
MVLRLYENPLVGIDLNNVQDQPLQTIHIPRQLLGFNSVKIIKKYPSKCFSSPRRLGGEKMPNVDPSHLIYEM